MKFKIGDIVKPAAHLDDIYQIYDYILGVPITWRDTQPRWVNMGAHGGLGAQRFLVTAVTPVGVRQEYIFDESDLELATPTQQDLPGFCRHLRTIDVGFHHSRIVCAQCDTEMTAENNAKVCPVVWR